MNTITTISAEIIKDSRGADTLLVTASSGDMQASFSVPSGASTGAHEAHELRDPDGKGVRAAVTAITTSIAPALIGHDVLDQRGVDALLCSLDVDTQKGTIGANSMLGVSGALVQLGALVSGVPLHQYLRTTFSDVPLGTDPYPRCYFNLINGGKHAHTGLAFQEYHIVPRCGSVRDDLACAKDIYAALTERISLQYPGTVLGDEGGFALDVASVETPLLLLKEIVSELQYTDRVSFALDVAASSFFDNGAYVYDGAPHSKEELSMLYEKMVTTQSFISIEDPFDEESFTDFSELRKGMPSVKIIGDDLTVTNTTLLTKAAEAQSIDGLIIKPNQIGTISETVAAISEAHRRGLVCIVSHRSGETMDTTIADIVVAFQCFGLKSGAPAPKERLVKYERLIAISQ
jgi:enolase